LKTKSLREKSGKRPRGHEEHDGNTLEMKENPKNIIVSDCWKSHFQSATAGRQLCIAHLVRELNYFQQRYKSTWAIKCKTVFMRSMAFKKQMNPDDCYNHQPPRSLIETEMDQLLMEQIDTEHKKVATFKKRMTKYRNHIFTFLYYSNVPLDKKGSERAIRNIKVKQTRLPDGQEISGQYKSTSGAEGFALLRYFTDTAIKNGQNVLNALLCVTLLNGTD